MVNGEVGALSRDEKLRVLLQNINGIEETLQDATRAVYAARKSSWNRGEAPAIDWPPAWYSRLSDGDTGRTDKVPVVHPTISNLGSSAFLPFSPFNPF